MKKRGVLPRTVSRGGFDAKSFELLRSDTSTMENRFVAVNKTDTAIQGRRQSSQPPKRKMMNYQPPIMFKANQLLTNAPDLAVSGTAILSVMWTTIVKQLLSWEPKMEVSVAHIILPTKYQVSSSSLKVNMDKVQGDLSE
jgi:hypothetical protein